MSTKRGASDLSLVVGIDKPVGLTSHDVVDICRDIFNERRVGHMGTLDPKASGVLLVAIGPATRLDAYLGFCEKTYEASIVFGSATDTDDSEGTVVRTGPIPEECYDPFFARDFIEKLVGSHQQLPPAYSAIKHEGKKAYEEARRGHVIELEARPIEIYDSKLLGINGVGGTEPCSWDVVFSVSKGTYIRALARDVGNAMGCPAHLGALRRTQSCSITLSECVTLDQLKDLKTRAALDPVRMLGWRFAFVDDVLSDALKSGRRFARQVLELCEYPTQRRVDAECFCTSGVHVSTSPPKDKEMVALICENRLYGIYEYDAHREVYQPKCIFSVGVSRG